MPVPTLGQLLNGFVKAIVGILTLAALVAAFVVSPWWWVAVIFLGLLLNHIQEEGAGVVFGVFGIAALIAGYVSTAWWWLVAGLLFALAVAALDVEPTTNDDHEKGPSTAGRAGDASPRGSGAGSLAAGLAAGYIAHEILDDDCDDGGD